MTSKLISRKICKFTVQSTLIFSVKFNKFRTFSDIKDTFFYSVKKNNKRVQRRLRLNLHKNNTKIVAWVFRKTLRKGSRLDGRDGTRTITLAENARAAKLLGRGCCHSTSKSTQSHQKWQHMSIRANISNAINNEGAFLSRIHSWNFNRSISEGNSSSSYDGNIRPLGSCIILDRSVIETHLCACEPSQFTGWLA